MSAVVCRRAMRQLAESVSGPPDGTSRARLEEHLTSCPDCRERAEKARGALEALLGDRVPDPGDAYWTSFPRRVRLRIQASGVLPVFAPHGPGAWPGLVATAALLLAAVAWLWSGIGRGRAPAPPAVGTGSEAPSSSLGLVPGAVSEGSPGDLDAILGEGDPLEGSVGIEDLSLDERRELLRSLVNELDAPV